MTRQGEACFSDQDALECKVEMLSDCLRKVRHFILPPYVDGDQHLGRGILGGFLPNAPHSLLTGATNAQRFHLKNTARQGTLRELCGEGAVWASRR